MRLRILAKAGIGLALCLSALPAFAAARSNDADEALSGQLSTNWAGYAAEGGGYTGVGATWTVTKPADATSTSVSTDATWVGIGGIKKKDLIQAGTQAIVRNGRVVYRVWYELLPDYQKQVALEVKAGDQVKVAISEVVPDLWLISFSNITTGQTFYQTAQYKSSKYSAEWIQEMPSVQAGGQRLYAPLDKFGTISFSGAYATQKDATKTPEDLRAHTITMVAKNIDLALATPSGLDGGAFVVTRSNATAAPAKSGKAGEIQWSRGK